MSRQCRFYVRLDEKELARLKNAAKQLGMSRSDYVRFISQLPAEAFSVPLDGQPTLMHFVFLDTQTAHRILIEASRWGTNYNQGVHALNLITSFLMSDNPDKYRDEILYQSKRAHRCLEEGRLGILALVERIERLKNAKIVSVDIALKADDDAVP